MNELIRQLLPPILLRFSLALKRSLRGSSGRDLRKDEAQDLEVYWDSKMASLLETWGEGTVWKEIQYFLVNCEGKVLDIACGTGKTIEIVSRYKQIEVYGCDISDFLINKAVERGIPKDHLAVCDATSTGYYDNYFDYAYSIGSLEHFVEDGITDFLRESKRITRKKSFHMIPVSRKGREEGWMKTYQSFYNNSIAWWLNRFSVVFEDVQVLDSSWSDSISLGKWFICTK